MTTERDIPSIHLRSVHKTFASPDPEVGEVRAVDGIDLTIRPGEIVALLGPNGAGKTTTLDMVLGFTAPSAGSISVFGVDPQQAVLCGRVAAVLQTGGLLRDLTVRETVELVASTHPNPQSPDAVIDRAGLAGIQLQRVQSCSGGEQQRLRFALALLGDPDLLVLDEPTTGMDVAARHEFWASMRAEAERGRTIVFATHYLQEAEDFAERTVLMANGRMVADGPTDEVRRHAAGRRLSARVEASPEAELAREWTAQARRQRLEIDKHWAKRRITWRERKEGLRQVWDLFREARQHLRRECLVDLDQVHVPQHEVARPAQRERRREHRPQAHARRVATRERPRPHTTHHRQPQLAGAALVLASAPSVICDELPAVTVPYLRSNTGLSLASASIVWFSRMPLSRSAAFV